MELDQDYFCTSCNASFTITFPKRKDELYNRPAYCPFCGESLAEETDLDYENIEDDD